MIRISFLNRIGLWCWLGYKLTVLTILGIWFLVVAVFSLLISFMGLEEDAEHFMDVAMGMALDYAEEMHVQLAASIERLRVKE